MLTNAVALICILCGGVASGDVIPAERRIQWNPGVQDGIPTYPVAIDATSDPYNADNTGAADCSAAINTALEACPKGSAVFLPAGAYRIEQTIKIPSQVVLRGAGPENTKLIGAVAEGDIISMVVYHSINVDAVGGYSRGSTAITVADASRFNVGDCFILDQLNDPALVNLNGDNCNYCSFRWDDRGTRVLGQIVQVTAVDGNRMSFEPPLVHTFEDRFKPVVRKIADNMIRRAGLEDLCIKRQDGTNGTNVYIQGAANCWVKHIESVNSAANHIVLVGCFRCEVRDSYMHHGQNYSGGRAYGVLLFNHCCDCLVENNAFYYLRHSMVIAAGGMGNVFGYNYSDCMHGTDYPNNNWIMADLSLHGAHPMMNLFEGNIGNHIGPDYTHGSSSHNTFFRNYVDHASRRPNGEPTTNHLVCVDIHAWNTYINIVGNVLGQPGDVGGYEIENADCSHSNTVYMYKLGYENDGDCSAQGNDPHVKTTLLRHGNYNAVEDAVRWSPDIPDHNLPDSLYLKSKPAFFGDLPWPAIGPDLSPRVGRLPARNWVSPVNTPSRVKVLKIR